jgi:hypothetical protein
MAQAALTREETGCRQQLEAKGSSDGVVHVSRACV